MAKRDDADDAVNAAVSGIVRIRTVIDVVFGRDGSVRLGHIFNGFGGAGFGGAGFGGAGFGGGCSMIMVIQDANAAKSVASIGFKYRNVVRVGLDGAALNHDE